MGKIKAALADVSTKFENPEPGVYEFKIVSIEDKTKMEGSIERPAYQVVSAIDEVGNEGYGKKVFEYCSLSKKDGSPNNAGIAEFKRYAEAVLGEDRANDPDLDTDELVNGRFRAEIVLEEWSANGKSGISPRLRGIQAL